MIPWRGRFEPIHACSDLSGKAALVTGGGGVAGHCGIARAAGYLALSTACESFALHPTPADHVAAHPTAPDAVPRAVAGRAAPRILLRGAPRRRRGFPPSARTLPPLRIRGREVGPARRRGSEPPSPDTPPRAPMGRRGTRARRPRSCTRTRATRRCTPASETYRADRSGYGGAASGVNPSLPDRERRQAESPRADAVPRSVVRVS